MTFMIAAAGTGGHVFPGLAIGEALLELGVDHDDISYVGGSRLEADVYPGRGFHFLQVELAGLRRSLTPQNLRLPQVVFAARKKIVSEMRARSIRVMLGMGGYVTIPAGLAARRAGVVFFNAEQNAEAGLANRVARRWAARTFVSFPNTGGIPDGEWVGNPVRRMFWDFHRRSLLAEARRHFEVTEGSPVVGVFGGSLGAGAINDAVYELATTWDGPDMTILHLTGPDHLETMLQSEPARGVVWRRIGFTDRMDLFYALSDLVVARAGGAVAELTATATPAVLVPGRFGSAGHQEGNARFLERAGAAVVVMEDEIAQLGSVVSNLVASPEILGQMRAASTSKSKPKAALTIARTMIEASQ
jgi:UDP-N-acetylglucosamine--N-acetylmuramyl-(pentapeptide) pyrophosphoryl-undecaprenol N-acetylglucosamine transferase